MEEKSVPSSQSRCRSRTLPWLDQKAFDRRRGCTRRCAVASEASIGVVLVICGSVRRPCRVQTCHWRRGGCRFLKPSMWRSMLCAVSSYRLTMLLTGCWEEANVTLKPDFLIPLASLEVHSLSTLCGPSVLLATTLSQLEKSPDIAVGNQPLQ